MDCENKIYIQKEFISLLGEVLEFTNTLALEKVMFIYGHII